MAQDNNTGISDSVPYSHVKMSTPWWSDGVLHKASCYGLVEHSIVPLFMTTWSTPCVNFLMPYGVLPSQLHWSISIVLWSTP